MMMKKTQNVVVLSTLYYPDMRAPSACIDKYVQRLKKYFDFHIITRTDESNFIPCETLDIRYITGILHKMRLWCFHNVKTRRYYYISKLILFLIDIIKFIQTQFSFPNSQKWETKAYFQQLEKLHEEQPIDTIIAVSNNIVTQLATLKFKKIHPNVKWIAFVMDPYAEYYAYYKYKLFKKLWRKLNFIKEQEIYDNCNYALFTAEMYRYVPVAFKIDLHKIFKIEFVLEKKFNPELVKNNEKTYHKKYRMIYAGLFYKVIRNPEFALKMLSKLNDIELDMYVDEGECEDIINRYISDSIRRYYHIEHSKYIHMINYDYDILINIGNNASLQAPSKMLELISTGKPIINFYYVKDSQFEMIEQYPLGMNIGRTDTDVVEKISEFCKTMAGKRISYDEIEKIFPHNNLESQVKLLRRLISS